MNNFSYCNPVNIVFGKGSIAKLADLTASYEKILMIYGGGSIKKNGVYDQVKAALKGKKLVEFAGIGPNPQLDTCLNAVELAKKEKVDLLLAVGGGSVLDAVKFISAAIKFEGSDPWEIMTSHGSVVKSSVPFGTVLTLPATGSEMNFFSVISRKDTDEKLAFASTIVYPKFSILDPEVTYSISKKYLRNGLVDAFIHVMEQYATYDVDTPLQDRQAEAIVKTVVEIADKVLSGKTDYNTMATFMWCSTLALNGLISCGAAEDWATHMIGHELTAFFGVDHAESLAIVLPGLWEHKFQQKKVKLAQLAERVFNVKESDLDKKAEAGIRKTVEFFHSVGMPTRLRDFNIPHEGIKKVVDRFKQRGTVLGEHKDIDAAQIEIILNRCV